MWVLFGNVQQLGFHRGAQTSEAWREEMAWPGEQRICTAALTHLPDVALRLTSVSTLKLHRRREGGPAAIPTDSYFSLNLCPLSWLAVIRLSLNLAVVCRGDSSALKRTREV